MSVLQCFQDGKGTDLHAFPSGALRCVCGSRVLNSSAAAAPSLPPEAESVAAAWIELKRLCNGGRFQMSIPANEARDSDLILAKGLGDLVKVVATLRSTLDAREQRIGELTREVAHETDMACQATVMLSVRNAELASREARIGELENENSALRSRL